MNENDLLQQQLQREKDCAEAGFSRFQKNQREQCLINNGSNTSYCTYVKVDLLPKIIESLEQKLSDVERIRESYIKKAIRKCVVGTTRSDGALIQSNHWDLEIAAFLAFQLTLDTALNPNRESSVVSSKHGGEKRILRKKNYSELAREIGRIVNEQLTLRIIMKNFPKWFRHKSTLAERSNEDGLKATTSYWSYRMKRYMDDLEKDLEEQGDHDGLTIVQNRNPWSSQDRSQVGAWLLTSVIQASNLFVVTRENEGKKSLNYIYLNDSALQNRQELEDICKEFQHDLLPMLIPPQPVTNKSLGGWFNNALQRPDRSFNGSIALSDQHLEFINRQSKVSFQVNPFIHKLFTRLVSQNLSLGKFFYYERQDIPEVNQLLGFASLDRERQNDAIAQLKFTEDGKLKIKEARKLVSVMTDRDKAKAKKAVLSIKLVEKTKRLLNDSQFWLPMSYDFRGRIYSRVPFTSFQSADPGRYLLRFAQQTPIDNRTKYWLAIGISNAAGNDKLSFGRREQWFHSHEDDIVNVGKMFDGGDFSRAYDFLSQDSIDDPFCLAALANEYVKVFIDKTQDFTQCYVCVDASCSGSAIFNAWRRNRTAGSMVNLTDNDSPADIYTEVWLEIKKLAKPGTFNPDTIAHLERTKLIRKMMKAAYVPAQYASPENRQFYELTKFNKSLAKDGIAFSDQEMQDLKVLWSKALDEVSSISTVIEWFQQRTQEALDNGADCIRYTSPNGSKMTLKYPKFQEKKIKTLHYGQAKWRQQKDQEVTDTLNTKKLLNAVTANITHLTDAAALCEAMWDWQDPMVCIHDAVGVPIGQAVDNAIHQLKDGFIKATSYDVWKVFREDNNLKVEALTSGPVIGDLDLAEIKDSDYLFS